MENQQQASSDVADLIRQRDHWKREAQKISLAYDVAEGIIADRTKRLFELQQALERIAGFTKSQFFGGTAMARECISVAQEALSKHGGPVVPDFMLKKDEPATANYPCGSMGEEVETEGGAL